MVTSIMDDVKRIFREGGMLTRLVFINVGVFVFVNLLLVVLFMVFGKEAHTYLDQILRWFEASYDLKHNLTRPWTIFTYMFLHKDLMHVLFNMLFLFWFGRVLVDLGGNRRVLPIYIWGGLAGFVFYVLSSFLLPEYTGPYCLGASAGVMAVVVASATLAPEYRMNLILIGPVPLKYLAAFFVFVDIIAIPNGFNTGGHFAHIGGALAGWFLIHQLKNGTVDWIEKTNIVFDKIANFFGNIKDTLQGKRKPKVAYKDPEFAKKTKQNRKASSSSDTHTGNQQEMVDAILEKIKRSGYASLTEEEKEFLFRASKDK